MATRVVGVGTVGGRVSFVADVEVVVRSQFLAAVLWFYGAAIEIGIKANRSVTIF